MERLREGRIPKTQLDYHFIGRHTEQITICVALAVDMQVGHHFGERSDKQAVDYVYHTSE